jgi:alpha-methylacyl-CoA racemase
VLADLGADVVKIESPSAPDYLRSIEGGGQFAALNRGKRSLSLDLKAPGGSKLLHRLCERADVLVEGSRPGALAKLGCAPGDLIAAHPRLVVCSISGFGQDGPWRDRAGHDITYSALAGVLARTGLGDAPVLPGVQLADFYGGAMQAVAAILAALLERERTGRGRALDVALCEGAMGLLLPHFGSLTAGMAEQKRGDDLLSGSRPCYRLYACKGGGAIALGALEPKFWERFCAAVSRPEWADRAMDRELAPEVDALFLRGTRVEWMERLEPADCCAEPVLEPAEARAHPHHRARGMFLESGNLRTLPALGPPSPRPVADLGQHTDEVLREHGLSEAEIAELRAAAVL